MSTLRLLQSTDEFSQLEGAWNDLLRQSPANNFFLTWEWLWNWWRMYAEEGDRLAIFVLENGDELRGIAPCYIRTRTLFGMFPVKEMMFLGTQSAGAGDVGSDYMDLIYRDGEGGAFVNLLFSALCADDLCDELSFTRMNLDSPMFRLLIDESRKYKFLTLPGYEYESPCIKLPETWEGYLSTRSSNLRHKIKSESRKLQKCHDVVFKRAQTQEDVRDGLKQLVSLHQMRWESRGMSGVFSNRKFLDFHAKVMSCLIEKNRLELMVLSENGRSRAAIYNFVYNNKKYFYQSGVDARPGMPAFGYLLHSHCIEDAIKRGLSEYDFLPKGGNDDYKDRFSNSFRKVSSIYMVRNKFLQVYVQNREMARSMYHKIKPLFVKKP